MGSFPKFCHSMFFVRTQGFVVLRSVFLVCHCSVRHSGFVSAGTVHVVLGFVGLEFGVILIEFTTLYRGVVLKGLWCCTLF